jgi:hypothetical protein
MAAGDPAPIPTSRVLDWPVNAIWILVELLPWIWVLWMVVHGIAWVIAMAELVFEGNPR